MPIEFAASVLQGPLPDNKGKKYSAKKTSENTIVTTFLCLVLDVTNAISQPRMHETLRLKSGTKSRITI